MEFNSLQDQVVVWLTGVRLFVTLLDLDLNGCIVNKERLLAKILTTLIKPSMLHLDPVDEDVAIQHHCSLLGGCAVFENNSEFLSSHLCWFTDIRASLSG